MTTVSDLPKDLQEVFFELGYWRRDEIIPTTVNSALGDEPHDGHISFFIRPSKSRGIEHGRGSPGYFMVGVGSENSPAKDRLYYFPPKANFMLSIIAVPGISRWAEQIDPRLGSGRLASIQWPEAIARAEMDEASQAKEALQQAVWTTPDGIYSRGASAEFFELPIGHPAKDFVEETLRHFGTEIQAVEKMSSDKRTPQTAPDVYNKYFPTLQAMKSIKALYETGELLWEDFPHLQGKPQINLLYPASGYHVGALSMAMALIDRGASGVDAVFTEIDGQAVDQGFKILFQWLRANPDFRGDLKIREEAAKRDEGRRLFSEFTYKRKTIRLTYAWNDSPQGMYFDPSDFESSDVVLIHDTADDVGETESLLLKQVLPLLRSEMSSKAIVMTNELDMHPFRRGSYDSPWSVLPVRGRRVVGSFGHGGGFPVRNSSVGVTWWSMPEIGISWHQSALVFSTNAPLLRNLQDPEDAKTLVDFSLVAGGREYTKVPDPGRSAAPSIFSSFEVIVSKEIGERDPQKLLKWCAKKIPDIPPEDQHYLALVAARLVVQWSEEERYGKHKPAHRLIPKELAPYVARALARERLIPTADRGGLSRLDRFGDKGLLELDAILLKSQTRTIFHHQQIDR